MRIIKPLLNTEYYEAYSQDILIGSWSYDSEIIFIDWLQDMQEIAIYGCTIREQRAKQARLADLRNGKQPKPLQDYLEPDARTKFRS